MGNTAFPRTKARKEWLQLFFTDAIETAIGTWAYAESYQPDLPAKDGEEQWFAILVPKSDDDTWGVWDDPKKDKEPLTVNIDTIEVGLMRYWEMCMGERDKLGYPDSHEDCDQSQLGTDRINQEGYFMQLCVADLTNGVDGDYDSITQSAVLELALFDQVVYA